MYDVGRWGTSDGTSGKASKMLRSKMSTCDDPDIGEMERRDPGVSGMIGGSIGDRSGITSSWSSRIDFVFVPLLRKRSANELALVTLRRGERRREPGTLSLLPLLLLRIENMLRTLMVSLPCPWTDCGMERSNVGEGGVATGAESSDDISDDMLSREPRSAPRREKYLRPRADFGGVGESSSGDPDAAGCTWRLGVEVDERTGERGGLVVDTEVNGPRVRPRPFDRVVVAAAGTG